MFSILRLSSLQYFLYLILWVLSLPAQAGLFDKNPFADEGPLDVEKAFVFDYQQEGNRINLYWTIPDDYYLYRDRIEIKGYEKTQLINRINSAAVQKDDPLFGKVWVYYTSAEVDLDLSSVSGDPVSENLQITYQGC